VADADVWTAFCDGASRGNPGPAAFGVVVCDPSGRVVAEEGRAIGVNTNQVAEYEGLIRSLQALREAGAARARVFTDSEFVVKQWSGGIPGSGRAHAGSHGPGKRIGKGIRVA
jgi:ribonuclease HI